MSENHDAHCWLNINNEVWWIGAIEMEWATGKRWFRLWRTEDDVANGLAFISLDMSRVRWDDYCTLACEMLQEQIAQEETARDKPRRPRQKRLQQGPRAPRLLQ